MSAVPSFFVGPAVAVLGAAVVVAVLGAVVAFGAVAADVVFGAVVVVVVFGAVVVVAGFLALVGGVWVGVVWAWEYRFRLVNRIKAMNIFFILEFLCSANVKNQV